MSDLIIGCLCLFLIFIKFHKNYTYLKNLILIFNTVLIDVSNIYLILKSNVKHETILTLQLCCLQRKDFVQK